MQAKGPALYALIVSRLMPHDYRKMRMQRYFAYSSILSKILFFIIQLSMIAKTVC